MISFRGVSTTSTHFFNRLSFYESSFHFFIKRFKLFNSLSSNYILALPTLKQSKEDYVHNLNTRLSLHKLAVVNSLRDLNNSTPHLSTSNILKPTTLSSLTPQHEPQNLADVLNIRQDNDLLTTKTLERIYNITRTGQSSGTKLALYLHQPVSAPSKFQDFSLKTDLINPNTQLDQNYINLGK